jgi:hypothetical protein
MGPYPVRGAWFCNRLSLEGTWSDANLLGHNQRPTVPEV